jgi:two-component system NtrC family sensor kinase
MSSATQVLPEKMMPLDSPRNQEALDFLGKLAEIDADRDDAQAEIMGELAHLLSIDYCALFLRDEATDHWVTKKAYSDEGGWASEVVPASDIGELIDVIQGGDGYTSQLADGKWAFSIPLMAGDKSLGALVIRYEQPEPDLDYLPAACSIFANNLQRSRNLRQSSETIAEMQTFQGQLLNSRNTLRALFDSSPASIYIVDPHYRLIAINMTRADLVGRPPQVLVGEDCFSAIYGREDPCPGCQVAEAFQSAQKTRRIEHRDYAGVGRVEIEVSTFPIWDNQHEIVQVFLYEEDVTERQQLQASLAQSEKLAAVGQLAAGVAHEINNPLTAIQANAQLLERSLKTQANGQREMVEAIIEASERASEAVRDLLDFARSERYQVAPTDLNETIQRTLALVGPELGSRSISLQFDPGFDLPLINASQDHLQGVWLNLLINALDAIDEGPGVITIKSRQLGDSIMVSVKDSGQGIPEDQLPRIFEPFFTTKEPGRGTGLGLSVCHQIVTRHGGQIRASSLPGKGANFTVILPIS